MRLGDFRLCVRAGHGLVARFPAAVLVVTAAEWTGAAVVDRLLEECGRTSSEQPLSERLAEVVEQAGGQEVPAFCAIADDVDGLTLFVHGDSQVVISGAQPVMRLAGLGTAGWTGGIHDRVASLVVGPVSGSSESAPTDDYVDLRDGIVPGGAIALLPAGPAVPAVPVPVPVPAEHSGREPLLERAPAQHDLPAYEADQPAPPPTGPPPRPRRQGLTPAASILPTYPSVPPSVVAAKAAGPNAGNGPPTIDAVPAAAVDGAPTMVWGIHCKRGHFNNPDARYCRMCGTHMVHQRRDEVLGPRPVLGFLVLDDGSTYKLDADYVIGQKPDTDAAVISGQARALRLSDPEDSVSPVHAAIQLANWDVFLTDHRSHYGTHVWKPGTDGWVRLDPGQRIMLEPRTHLLFGRRTMVFDSVNRH